MPLHTGNDEVRSSYLGVNAMFGQVVIGASGAITSQDTPGFTVSKQGGDGLYRVVLDQAVHELLWAHVQLNQQSTPVGAVIHEDADLSSGTTFDVQVTNTTTGAALNPASGDTLKFALFLRTSSVTP